jgi:N-glycosylase/DNA lyase
VVEDCLGVEKVISKYWIEYRYKARVDLDVTLDCGQSFAWQKREDGSWCGWIGDYPAEVVYAGGNGLEIETAAPLELVNDYFQVDRDWDGMMASFPRDDRVLESALEFAGGMVLLRQPIWETTACFILSAQKRIVHIQVLTQRLRRRLGKRVGKNLFTFPSYGVVAKASEEVLRGCGLGFRAKNLLTAARQLAGGEVCLSAISKMDYWCARGELQRLQGVGPKIADCVCLFALGHFEAFPFDTWMIRMMREIYFPRTRRLRMERMERFAAKYFGQYRGYAQQILFHWMRKMWKGGETLKKGVL